MIHVHQLKNFGTVIYFATKDDTKVIAKALAEDKYEMVATVHEGEEDKSKPVVERLERAYRLTNTIEQSWWNNVNVWRSFAGEGCRSTSVGDVIQLDDDYYVVAMVGFAKVDMPM